MICLHQLAHCVDERTYIRFHFGHEISFMLKKGKETKETITISFIECSLAISSLMTRN